MDEKQYPEYLKSETKKIWITTLILILLGIAIIGFLAFVFVFNEMIAEKFGMSLGTTPSSDSDIVTTGSCISLWNFKLQSACYKDNKLKIVLDNKDDIDIDSIMIKADTLSGDILAIPETGITRTSIRTLELETPDINYITISPAVKSGGQILVCKGDIKTAGKVNSKTRISDC